MSDEPISFPPDLKNNLLSAAIDAFEEPKNEDRRSLEIRTSFYDKLSALDAGSIAVAASIGIAMIAKSELQSASLRSNASWLVVITILFWASLICAITHNLLAVKIVELETAYSHDEFCKTIARKIIATAKTIAPTDELAQGDLIEEQVLEIFIAKQRDKVKRRDILRPCSTTVGHISIGSFLIAYTLVMARVVCLWWAAR